MLAKDNVKIKYSSEGYLPNYPPHLISDEEMCEAFLTGEFRYFEDNYPLATTKLQDAYDILVNAFRFHIARFLSKVEAFQQDLPDWVYSYMLGHVVSKNSDQADRHYLLVGIHRDNMDDILDETAQLRCYEISTLYVNKLSKDLKFININKLLSSKSYYVSEENPYQKIEKPMYSEIEKQIILDEMDKWGVKFDQYNMILMRPPTMFGEQHIIKLIRLDEVK